MSKPKKERSDSKGSSSLFVFASVTSPFMDRKVTLFIIGGFIMKLKERFEKVKNFFKREEVKAGFKAVGIFSLGALAATVGGLIGLNRYYDKKHKDDVVINDPANFRLGDCGKLGEQILANTDTVNEDTEVVGYYIDYKSDK